MSYKVVGAAAVVELDDGKPEIGTGPRVYLEQNAAVPEHAKAKHLEHLLKVGLIEQVKGDDSDPPSNSSLPPFQADASDAEKMAWVESGTVQEIVAAVNAQPEILPAVIAAEESRKGDARKTLLDALARMSGGS
jgi:hypothetical protein